jgi:hypothetical protein
MNCYGKIRYKTRASAERRAIWDLKRHGVSLRVYPCGKCRGFHLSHLPLAEFLDRATDTTLRETATGYGQEITADERRLLEQELRRIAELVDADRRWLTEEAERARIEADRIRDLADSLRIANRMELEKTR